MTADPVPWAIPGVPHPAVDLSARVREVADGFCAGADVAPLGSQLVALREAIDTLEAAWLAGAAAFDAAGGPADDGHGTLAGWLRARCLFAPGEASTRARLATVLGPGLAGSMPATSTAMAEGTISWRHAQVIERTLHDVPAPHRGQAEAALAEPAKTLDPLLLKRVGQDLLHRLDVERAEAAAVRRLDRRGLSVAETFDGMVAVSGLLDPVAGASVLTALDAITDPARGDLTDDRTWPQRRADALAELARHSLDSGDQPATGGVRPHLTALVDLSVLRQDLGCGTAQLDWAGPITAEQARQLACDATISRVITDGPSQILDVGRATRTIPPALRRAVVARDRTCIAPGCHAHPGHCDVHHVIHWADGGPTSLDNCALFCRRHHGFVHERGWQVRTGTVGAKTFHPPDGRPPPKGPRFTHSQVSAPRP